MTWKIYCDKPPSHSHRVPEGQSTINDGGSDPNQTNLYHGIVCQPDEGIQKQEGDGTQRGKGPQTMLNLFGGIGNSTKEELAIVWWINCVSKWWELIKVTFDKGGQTFHKICEKFDQHEWQSQTSVFQLVCDIL